jgi:hypothetical protein
MLEPCGVFFEWLMDRRSGVAISLAVVMLVVTFILRYGFDLWWPWGIGMATALGVLGLFAGKPD